MIPFDGCRRRIERANAQGIALAQAWNSIPHKDLYGVSAHVNSDGTGSIRFGRAQPLPPTFALVFGEMLYQLRSALDGAIHQAAIFDSGQNPPPDEDHLEFPIFMKRPSASDYAKKTTRMLGPLKQKRRDIIESVQPYNAPNLAPDQMVSNGQRVLGIMHDWARKDRHRRLHLVGAWAQAVDSGPTIRVPQGVTLTSL